MNTEQAENYLQQILKGSVSDVTPIEMGNISRVYSFHHDGRDYVIHFRDNRYTFDLNHYIFNTYSKANIPIPAVTQIGSIHHMFYSISAKAPGRAFDLLSAEEAHILIPELIHQLNNIRNVNIDQTNHWGSIKPSGHASFNCWQASIASFFENDELGIKKNWHSLFETSFLERDVFNHAYAIMNDLLQYAPNEKYLVHGDFHHGNIITDGRTITGIIDWEMVMYGDFMFDVANFHLWRPQANLPQYAKEVWLNEGLTIPYFEERLLCYQLVKCLDALRYFAIIGDEPGYEFVKSRMQDVLGAL